MSRISVRALFPLIIVAIPLFPLLSSSDRFGTDWDNHLWMIDYARQSLQSRGRLPDTYNVAAHVGMPQPIFYAPVLYPCLALLSIPLGVDFAVRLACAVLMLMQFKLVRRLMQLAGCGAWEAIGITAMVCWAVYPLSDLYTRADLPEFFGTGLLLCAIAAGGAALLEPSSARRRAMGLLGAMCAALAFGSHGTTALIGAPLLLLLTICVAPMLSMRAVYLALVVIAVSSPWLYAVGTLGSKLAIAHPNPYMRFAGKLTSNPRNDTWWARLSPLPLGVPTPKSPDYLRPIDAQWNFPIVLLAAWNAAAVWRRGTQSTWRHVMAVSAAACAALIAVSVSSTLQDALPQRLAAGIQFPFRLVSHANAAALVVLASARLARGGASTEADRRVWTIALVISLAAVGLKLLCVITSPEPLTNGISFEQAGLPDSFYGQNDYAVEPPSGAAPEGAIRILEPTGLGPDHDPSATGVKAEHTEWVATSIISFPWNRLYVDGQPVPFDRVHSAYFHEAVELQPGMHSLEYHFEPPPVWVALRWISWIVFIAGAIATLICFTVRPRPAPWPAEPPVSA